MKNTTWVFGSMLAAGCMLLSVPVTAQGNFPQGIHLVGRQGRDETSFTTHGSSVLSLIKSRKRAERAFFLKKTQKKAKTFLL